jgi:hypothetical protein
MAASRLSAWVGARAHFWVQVGLLQVPQHLKPLPQCPLTAAAATPLGGKYAPKELDRETPDIDFARKSFPTRPEFSATARGLGQMYLLSSKIPAKFSLASNLSRRLSRPMDPVVL